MLDEILQCFFKLRLGFHTIDLSESALLANIELGHGVAPKGLIRRKECISCKDFLEAVDIQSRISGLEMHPHGKPDIVLSHLSSGFKCLFDDFH